ncbi:hypothetical protein LINPERHAP2_LOCUS9326 [Linum perenne]
MPPSLLLRLVVAAAAAQRLQPPSKESTISAVQVVGSDSVRPDACRSVVPPSNRRFVSSPPTPIRGGRRLLQKGTEVKRLNLSANFLSIFGLCGSFGSYFGEEEGEEEEKEELLPISRSRKRRPRLE